MKPIYLRLISFLALCIASSAFAQDRKPDQTAPSMAAPTATGSTLTGKERMGRKWMDEQRIDNCNVPTDKRGSKPRPGDCLHSPSS
ncbi:hypothetical protein [Bradyrhizobium sp.]|uniref:hypothetical protein n=1 Tax=Bradyrhizobium sp. TaxID=376 RepID=UPI002B6BB54C|nr:hypothetical protein [Bradyrhizobium sp.]HMM89683.1 hypothetical protein [Bradyrhizobium sp.]